MKEDFLHYLWKFQKWKIQGLKTTDNKDLAILSPGQHNLLSGPDFFNSRIAVDGQEWAGNVEIHINSSDWYFHGHETDPNYENVILHVVWNHDVEVFRKDNSVIPTFELNSLVTAPAFKAYDVLLDSTSGKWINCEADFHSFDDFLLNNWLERIYFERLEEKSEMIFNLLEKSANNWEEVLFTLLCKNFGLNVNGDSFYSIACSVPFTVIQKEANERQNLEAIFFGQAGILEAQNEEKYFQDLKQKYSFLKSKYKLNREGITPVKFFRLRPDNFPNIRLSQLAGLYHQKSSGLFSEIINSGSVKALYHLLEVRVSKFWESHYTFNKSHNPKKKELSKNFKDLIIINTLIPLKFCYGQKIQKPVNEELLEILYQLKNEDNQIISRFLSLRPKVAKNAFHSQALLQLKQNYCENHQCLKCNLGLNLLQREEQI